MGERNAGAAVRADALSLRGPRGPVYRDIGFEAAPGALVAVAGPAGSGRTSLLLTLAGRMRPGSGRAEIDGLALPGRAAAVRRIAALGPVPGVNDPDPVLDVGAHLRERIHLHGRLFARPARRDTADRTNRALATAGLPADRLPHGLRTPVEELDALDRLRLGLALALLGEPRLICTDDVDDRLHGADRDAAWQLLRTVADTGTTVVVATTDTAHAADRADLTVHTAPGAAPVPGAGDPAGDRPDEPAASEEETTDAHA
ncbi:ATP-binding cassette domain-containing protein [Kitasatospora sp. NBC_01539]|uniref:ATP-binding cassette domain-containing protein n=1 Tax=Kitasatospora sp. NBC_01539 TaxID=2903577 RepID=UPI00386022AE